MGKPKFKIGDTVEILDGSKIENYTWGWTSEMADFIGKTGEITNINNTYMDGRVGYVLNIDRFYMWDERCLKFAKPENESIVIYRKNNTVVALDKRTGERAIARCNPIDTFDFNIGAKIAFNRLMGIDEPIDEPIEKPLYNGRVVCVDNKDKFGSKLQYTVGKIYEFKNGQLTTDAGWRVPYNNPVHSFGEFAANTHGKFIEIVE